MSEDRMSGRSSRAYVCTVPAVPPSLNVYTRMHWAKQAKEREAFQELVWVVLNEKDNRCPRPRNAKAMVEAYVRGMRDAE